MKQKGFTVIEIIIIVMITGFVASVCISALKEYADKKAAQAEEQHVIEDKAPSYRIPTIPANP